MSLLRAFRPLASTQNTIVGTTASAVNLNAVLGSMSIRVCNVGTQTVFIRFREAGDAVDATFGNAIPVPAGQTEVFGVPTGTTSISMIASATGSTVYTTLGEGL